MLKISGVSESLMYSLIDRGHSVIRLPDNKIICSPYYDKAQGVLFVPDEVIRSRCDILPLIDCEERVDRDFYNRAKIICGAEGKALIPYLVHRSIKVQARFGVPWKASEITVFQESSIVIINKLEIIMKNAALKLRQQKLWSGCAVDLPPGLSDFAAAVRAAQNKAKGLNPIGAHFVQEKNIIKKKIEDHGK